MAREPADPEPPVAREPAEPPSRLGPQGFRGDDAPAESLPAVSSLPGPEGSGPEGSDADGSAVGARPGALNGLGLSDWLIEPLASLAADSLELLKRSEVPPRLAPLAGRRPGRRLRRADHETILSGLGRHSRFTEAVFDLFREAENLDDEPVRSVEEIIADIDEGGDDPAHAVCRLLVADRLDDARAVAEWAEKQDEPGDPELLALVDSLQAAARDARREADALARDLAAQRRKTKRLERRLAEAEKQQQAAVRAQAQAERLARDAEAEVGRARSGTEALARDVERVQTELEAGRRERRDLLAELEGLQERFRRQRRELKDTRARVPAEAEPAPVLLRPAEAPPTIPELHARRVAEGEAGVLNARHIVVMVDGWNVGLGEIAAERLEDKRRLLEQALIRYQARTGNRVMVVYDGRRVSWFWVPSVQRSRLIRVFTSEGESADDYIVSELEAGSDGLTPVVVTSDQVLGGRCRALGAFVLSSQSFARFLDL